MKKRDALACVGLSVLGAASLYLTPATAATTGASAPTSEFVSSAEIEPARDPVFARPHGRWAIGVGIGTAIAALVSLIGYNGLLRVFGEAARTVGAVATAPVKAARVAVTATAKALKKPGKFLIGTSAVTLGLIATVLILDAQWKAGLLVGAGVTLAAVFSGKRLLKRRSVPRAAATA